MIIDYNYMAKLIDVRVKQIDDISKESSYYNKEYIELIKMRRSLSELIVLQRDDWQDYDNRLILKEQEDISNG